MKLTTTAWLKKRLLPMLGAVAALGCMPDVPPEADPPEVEVSGGELPEYEYDAAELEEPRDERVALEPPEPREGDFEQAERFLE
jgi:hypothetical protein